MKEIPIKGKDFQAYAYVIDDKFYILDKKLEEKTEYNPLLMKSTVYRKKIEEFLAKNAYLIHTIPNPTSLKEKKKNTLKLSIIEILAAFLSLLTICVFADNIDNFVSSKLQEMYERKSAISSIIATPDIDYTKNSLNKIWEYIEKYNPTDEEINVMVDNFLLSDFETREEGFLFYARECINQNRYLTKEEKEALINETETKINTYGEYYEGHTILNAFIEYANVPVARDYDTDTAYFRHEGDYGLIVYNPFWENAYQTLNHENSHAEGMNEPIIIPFFSETRAAFLSNDGYPISRKVMTILGLLGDDEVILKALINYDYDRIRENLLSKFSGSDKEMMQGILTSLEQIEDPDDLEEYCLGNEELINQLNTLYTARYGTNPQENTILILLEYNIRYGENDYIKYSDNLVLNDRLVIHCNINGTIMEFTISSSTTEQDFSNSLIKVAIEYLKQNSINFEEKVATMYQNNDTIWLARMIIAEQPYQVLCSLNEIRSQNNMEPLNAGDIFSAIIGLSDNLDQSITISDKEGLSSAQILILKRINSEETDEIRA